jgi:hypothetical protein
MDKKETILNSKKFALFGKPAAGGKGPPKLSFDVFNGNPSITVFPNDPNDTENGKPIRAAMAPRIWGAFVEFFMSVLDLPPGEHRQFLNYQGHPQKTFVDTVTVMGKTPEGVVYIGITKKGRPAKKFDILNTVYSDVADGNGNPIPEGDKSVLYAKGFIRELDRYVSHYMIETYQPPQPQQGGQRQGGGGGNWNNRNDGGGGNQQQQSSGGGSGFDNSFEDDLPM